VTDKFRFVRLREVKEMTGLGETRILELEKAGKFPKRVKISDRAVAWVESELKDWVDRRLASRAQAV
jgi:prophage regulatory protein